MKTTTGKLLNLAIAVVFAGMVLTAANAPVLAKSHAQAHANASLKTFRWYGLAGTTTWAQTLDPSQITDSISYNIANMIQANLVKLLPNGKVAPGLATKWKISKNHLVYTYYMRHARFSNGDPVTAQDVVWSLTRSLAKSTNSPVALLYDGFIHGAADLNSGKTSKLAGAKALSKYVVQITLDKPIAFWNLTLTYPTADVLDPRIEQGKKPQTYMTQTCAANVGAGPFMPVCLSKSTAMSSFYRSGSTPTLTLVSNPFYYGHKPKIKVVMPAIADTQTNYRDFLAGGIDVTGIPTPDIAKNKGKPGFYKFPTSVVDYMTPNSAMAPFNNVHCRLAVAYAINRDAINKDILHGAQVTTNQVLPRNFKGEGYFNAKAGQVPTYNPAKAKAELAQCPGGIKNVTLPYQHTSSDIDNEYRAIQAMLGAIGASVKLKPLSFNDWLTIVTQSLTKTNTQISENLWIEDYPDPQDYMTNLLRTGANYDIGNYDNPTYNKLVDKAEVTFNKAKRAALYIQAQKIALNDGAWISIGNSLGFALVKSNVKGLVGSAAYGALVPKNDDWSQVSV